MSEHRLITEILQLSESCKWDIAKLEWYLQEVYEAEEPETCLCGHFPIIEICVLANKINGNSAIVGNCCVKRFIGLPSEKIFQAVKRVRKDVGKSLNTESVQHAFECGWISEWERDFYLNIMFKRSLSPKQRAKKVQINEKLMQNIKRRGRPNGQ